MPKYLSIQVPEPCHEDWNNMTATEQGRHCNACAKTVVDFSVMTDAQVLNYFKKDTGATCGRFHNTQIENDILIPTKQIPWLKYFFTISIPAFLFSLKINAQAKIDSAKIENPKNKKTNPAQDYMRGGYTIYDSAAANGKREMTTGEVWIKKETLIKKENLIEGIVNDDEGNPISNATIKLKGTEHSTTSDEFGNFKFFINRSIKNTLTIISEGDFKEIEIDNRTKYIINLENSNRYHQGIIAHSYKPKKVKKSIPIGLKKNKKIF